MPRAQKHSTGMGTDGRLGGYASRMSRRTRGM